MNRSELLFTRSTLQKQTVDENHMHTIDSSTRITVSPRLISLNRQAFVHEIDDSNSMKQCSVFFYRWFIVGLATILLQNDYYNGHKHKDVEM